ncbi:hypothetical protein D7Y44_04820 [Stenotrophomonas maltophilia]|uniref:hypothetical protein n=1 Tax=Stenotrophomonas maltophilia TaxID=40324 RepID=UPI0015DFB23A|nr:hypothetical protein [Stenotrophomonas maltophilia]MBA0282148.1 hypothetical protein [Stenotrophomonas maltophilia]MBA0345391.1 hypothetical protein [Stenotrophomonas maltophilia]MBA0356770.1 hypothetical protein [Stenotrophomonas maltophilia]MBA0520766.1 hypothetical protein [Stenotrophomonas maltophilia]
MPQILRPSLSASLVLLCVAGVLLRVAFLVVIPVVPISDFARYLEVATNVANGSGLSVSGSPFISQPPLYPGLLGAWLSLFGVHVIAAKALNLLLSSSTLALWAWACPRTGMRPGWQLASLAVLTFHPALVAYTGLLGTETLAVFLAVLAFALTTLPMRAAMPALLGIVLALVALNRPQLLPLPVGLVIGVLAGRGGLSRIRSCLVILVAFLAVLLPWIMRNELLFDRVVPVSANSGYVLMVNNNALNRSGNWMPLSQVPLSEHQLQRFQGEAAVPMSFFDEGDEDAKILQWTPAADGVARSVALDWMRQNPVQVLHLAMLRLESSLDPATLMYWPLVDLGGAPRWLVWGVGGLNLMLVLLAAIGTFRLLPQARQLTLTQLMALGTVALGVLSIAMFEGQGRYLIPLVPAMLILAGGRSSGSGTTVWAGPGHAGAGFGKVSSTS